jgi:hypothetical protein
MPLRIYWSDLRWRFDLDGVPLVGDGDADTLRCSLQEAVNELRRCGEEAGERIGAFKEPFVPADEREDFECSE